MSDFLDNLATRIVNPSGVVQPRLPSLFEPASATGELGKEAMMSQPLPDSYGEEEFELPNQARKHPPSFSAERPKLQVETSSDQPDSMKLTLRPLDLTYDHPVIEPAPKAARDASREFPTRLLSPKAPTSPTGHGADSPPLLATAERHLDLPEPATRQARQEQENSPKEQGQIIPEANRRSDIARSKVLPRDSLPQSPTHVEQRIKSQSPDAVQSRVEQYLKPQSPILIQPRVEPFVRPQTPIRAETATSPPQPNTIQVTIGRIEIRATPSSTSQARKPQPSSLVMSLDEYLLKRNKGGM